MTRHARRVRRHHVEGVGELMIVPTTNHLDRIHQGCSVRDASTQSWKSPVSAGSGCERLIKAVVPDGQSCPRTWTTTPCTPNRWMEFLPAFHPRDDQPFDRVRDLPPAGAGRVRHRHPGPDPRGASPCTRSWRHSSAATEGVRAPTLDKALQGAVLEAMERVETYNPSRSTTRGQGRRVMTAAELLGVTFGWPPSGGSGGMTSRQKSDFLRERKREEQ